jgi:hypothetical protein
VRVDFEVVGPSAAAIAPTPAGQATEAPCTPGGRRAQPPEVKLVLGHYCSPERGIGLVIDRTQKDTATIRFDGTDQTQRLFARYYWDHTDYHRAKYDKVLEVKPDGQIIVTVSGQEMLVYRDGDADPL